MTAKDHGREQAALSSYVTGTTLEMGAYSEGQLPGTTLVDRERASGPLAAYSELPSYADGSVQAIVSRCGLETVLDPWKCLREWRRVLGEGGTLALICSAEGGPHQTFTSASVVRLLRLAGFELKRQEPVTPGSTFLVVGQKSAFALVRGVLATFGPELAETAVQSEACRAELYFHFGTVLLQSGDAGLAERCFKTMLNLEPENSDGIFGLGMCYGTQQLWPEALTEFHRVVALDPNNDEARRWLKLAKEKVGGKPAQQARQVAAGLRV